MLYYLVLFFHYFFLGGKNLNFLTEFFINYIPFYNKFRAVSSIQVILEFCLPILAVIGLNHLFNNKEKLILNDFSNWINPIYDIRLSLFVFRISSFTGLMILILGRYMVVNLVSKIKKHGFNF